MGVSNLLPEAPFFLELFKLLKEMGTRNGCHFLCYNITVFDRIIKLFSVNNSPYM